jgi:hypothetical protein
MITLRPRRFATQVQLNGKPVAVEWSRAAHAHLARRSQPLTLELELYFSCLVKKFVHFHESVPARETIAVGEHASPKLNCKAALQKCWRPSESGSITDAGPGPQSSGCDAGAHGRVLSQQDCRRHPAHGSLAHPTDQVDTASRDQRLHFSLEI